MGHDPLPLIQNCSDAGQPEKKMQGVASIVCRSTVMCKESAEIRG
jgi:hypothetical protein